MSPVADAFFRRDPSHASRFLPTELTRGPWDNGAQHGGPPCALLARAIDAYENPVLSVEEEAKGAGHPPVVHPRRAHITARLTFSLLRPVPLTPLQVRVLPGRLGRQVHRLSATLSTDDGQELIRADAVRILRSDAVASTVAVPTWCAPEQAEPLTFSFFRHPVGYHRGVDLRVAVGRWGQTPIAAWGRLRVPLVEGERPTALQTIVALADAQSGVGVPLDPLRHVFVNPDLSIFLDRDPVPGWVGFDILSTSGGSGAGLAQSALRDIQGALGRSAQTLVVAKRSPG